VFASDYFPFGLTFNESQRTASTPQRFKYNSFEYIDDLGLGLLDYQARHYDPEIGRFLQVDPATDLMRRHSPYNYAFDNPIRFIDPDGMMPEEVIDGEEAGGRSSDCCNKELKGKESSSKTEYVYGEEKVEQLGFTLSQTESEVNVKKEGTFAEVDGKEVWKETTTTTTTSVEITAKVLDDNNNVEISENVSETTEKVEKTFDVIDATKVSLFDAPRDVKLQGDQISSESSRSSKNTGTVSPKLQFYVNQRKSKLKSGVISNQRAVQTVKAKMIEQFFLNQQTDWQIEKGSF